MLVGGSGEGGGGAKAEAWHIKGDGGGKGGVVLNGDNRESIVRLL